LILQGLFSQHTFQRIYEISDRQMIHLGMAVASSGGFYLVNVYDDEDDDVLKFHITKHSLKGDVTWSFDYELDQFADGFNIGDFDADIIEISNKDVVVALTGLMANQTDQDIIFQIDPNGEVVWSSVADSQFENEFLSTRLTSLKSFEEGFVTASSNAEMSDDVSHSYMASYGSNGTATWSKLYKTDNNTASLNTAMDVCTVDPSFVVAGITKIGSVDNMYVSKLDIDGNILWSRSYLNSIDDQAFVEVQDIACANDTTIVVVGSVINPFQGLNEAFILKLDKDGLPIWTRALELDGINANTQVAINDANTIFVAGKSIQLGGPDSNKDYVLRVDPNGQLMWSKTFPRIMSFVALNDISVGQVYEGDLLFNEQELMYSGTAINLQADSYYPFVVRMDQMGSAECEEDDNAMLNDTLLSFATDTLLWSVEDFGTFNEIEIDIDTFDNYGLPIVSILDTFFCPQDPIEVTLDATTDHAQSYEWSTGETTPTLEVTEEGMYMVTVTFDTLTCFTLCDTSSITVLEFPAVNLGGDVTNYCETGEYLIAAGPSMGRPPYVYEWSTGEEEQIIAVTELGDYAVTITDACGNTASQTLAFTDETLPDVEWKLNQEADTICGTRIFIQSAMLNNITDIVWSNGVTEETEILVEEGGTYSVTANLCGEEMFLDIEVVDSAVEFPNVFFPESAATGAETINKTFGPYIRCPDLIEDFEMRVFNRWGKLVFETENPEARWNGSFDAKAMPSDVFHWFARYTTPEGEDVFLEGDVTLLRTVDR